MDACRWHITSTHVTGALHNIRTQTPARAWSHMHTRRTHTHTQNTGTHIGTSANTHIHTHARRHKRTSARRSKGGLEPLRRLNASADQTTRGLPAARRHRRAGPGATPGKTPLSYPSGRRGTCGPAPPGCGPPPSVRARRGRRR